MESQSESLNRIMPSLEKIKEVNFWKIQNFLYGHHLDHTGMRVRNPEKPWSGLRKPWNYTYPHDTPTFLCKFELYGSYPEFFKFDQKSEKPWNQGKPWSFSSLITTFNTMDTHFCLGTNTCFLWEHQLFCEPQGQTSSPTLESHLVVRQLVRASSLAEKINKYNNQ